MAAIKLNITISERNGQPIMILRREINDLLVIKAIIKAAYYDEFIKVLPQFNDKLRSTAMLQEKGLIYLNKEKNKWEFTV